MKKFVLDSSVLVEGFTVSAIKNFEYYTTYSALDELKFKLGEEKVEEMIALGLIITQPSEQNLNRVKETTNKMGESSRLSKVDIDLLTLAIDLNATILTDDYSIQNIAKELGLKYIVFAQKGIRNKIIWKYRCSGCNRYLKDFVTQCPICGHRIKTVM